MDSVLVSNIITLAALGMIALGVGGVSFIGLRTFATASRRRARLVGGTAVVGGESAGMGEALSSVVSGVRRLGDRIAIQDPAQLSSLRAKLMLAGYYSREAAAIYLGVKAASMIAAILGIVLLLPLALGKHGGMLPMVGGAAFALVAIMGPDQFIKMRRTKREREYREGFPDLLDLLVASVEAGLSLDAGVTRVTDELHRRYPNLAEHLKVLTLELRAGRAAGVAVGARLAIAAVSFILPASRAGRSPCRGGRPRCR